MCVCLSVCLTQSIAHTYVDLLCRIGSVSYHTKLWCSFSAVVALLFTWLVGMKRTHCTGGPFMPFCFLSPQKQNPNIRADCKTCQFFCKNLSMLVKHVSQSGVLNAWSLSGSSIWGDSGNFRSRDILARNTFVSPVLFLCFLSPTRWQIFSGSCSFWHDVLPSAQSQETMDWTLWNEKPRHSQSGCL